MFFALLRRIDVAEYPAGPHDDLAWAVEFHDRHRLALFPKNLRRDARVRFMNGAGGPSGIDRSFPLRPPATPVEITSRVGTKQGPPPQANRPRRNHQVRSVCRRPLVVRCGGRNGTRYAPQGRITDAVDRDGHAFVAAGPSGVRVFDVRDPDDPREIGYYKTGNKFVASEIAVHRVAGSNDYYLYVANSAGPARVLLFDAPAAPPWHAAREDSRSKEIQLVCVVSGIMA